jgi:hypothetical protein
MNTCSKGLLLSVFGLLAGQQATAGSPAPVDSLTCTRSDGSTLKHYVYAYTLDMPKAGSADFYFFTAYFSSSLLSTYLEEEFFESGFSSCAFEKVTGALLRVVTIVDVDAAGLGANVGALAVQGDSVSQTYTEVTFAATTLKVDDNTVPTAAPSSPEEQAKALAAFKAKGLAIPK